jgi:hypothetical protein
MPIIRRRHRRNFTIVGNKLLNDKRLSSDERALMVDLLSRPDNWKIIPRAVAGRMHWGRDKTYRVLKSLIEKGYLTRVQDRDTWTRSFGPTVYTVYSDPDDNPDVEAKIHEPLPEIPPPENQVHIRRTDTHQVFKKEKTFNIEALPPPPSSSSSKPLRVDVLQHRLAERLSPGDVAAGYGMLPEGRDLDELCRKQASGALTEQDLARVKLNFIARRNGGAA